MTKWKRNESRGYEYYVLKLCLVFVKFESCQNHAAIFSIFFPCQSQRDISSTTTYHWVSRSCAAAAEVACPLHREAHVVSAWSTRAHGSGTKKTNQTPHCAGSGGSPAFDLNVSHINTQHPPHFSVLSKKQLLVGCTYSSSSQ